MSAIPQCSLTWHDRPGMHCAQPVRSKAAAILHCRPEAAGYGAGRQAQAISKGSQCNFTSEQAHAEVDFGILVPPAQRLADVDQRLALFVGPPAQGDVPAHDLGSHVTVVHTLAMLGPAAQDLRIQQTLSLQCCQQRSGCQGLMRSELHTTAYRL